MIILIRKSCLFIMLCCHSGSSCRCPATLMNPQNNKVYPVSYLQNASPGLWLNISKHFHTRLLYYTLPRVSIHFLPDFQGFPAFQDIRFQIISARGPTACRPHKKTPVYSSRYTKYTAYPASRHTPPSLPSLCFLHTSTHRSAAAAMHATLSARKSET